MQALWKLHTVVCRDWKCPYVVSLSIRWQMCGHFGQLCEENPVTLPPVLNVVVDDVASVSRSMQVIVRESFVDVRLGYYEHFCLEILHYVTMHL